MPKLPSAPLVEVIFELRWSMDAQEALEKYAYLPGEFYSQIKARFPVREPQMGAFLSAEQGTHLIAHRYRPEPAGYPLLQVGPGIFTVNVTEHVYEWPSFRQQVSDSLETLFALNPFPKKRGGQLMLQYIDFLPFDFQQEDILAFLESHMRIRVEQGFFNTDSASQGINLALRYPVENGIFTFQIQETWHQGQHGIFLIFAVGQLGVPATPTDINTWLDAAHAVCSSAFKDLTEGALYETFQQQPAT